ncbi:hypothetical protein IU397_14575 [Actibacterium sp. 188UL27-1]|nr:hypothetical protein [Actibacterium sp. 188UL27-1]
MNIARHSLLSISCVSGQAHQVERRERDIRSASQAFYLLSLQIAESSRVSQFGHDAVLHPGDMALYSSSEPYRLDLSAGFGQMVVQLPAEMLTDRLPQARSLTAHKISGQSGIGKLVQETLVDLIATCLAASGPEKYALSRPEQQVILRAKAFIRDIPSLTARAWQRR